MSYDILFWKQKRGFRAEPEVIYRDLLKPENLKGLQRLPVKQILGELKKLFSDFNQKERFPLVTTDTGSIEPGWSEKHFSFTSRPGGSNEHEMHMLVRLMQKFGCPLYDPQLNKRFKLHDSPPFRKAEPEEPEIRNLNDHVYDALSPDDDLAAAIRKMKQIEKQAGKRSTNRPNRADRSRPKR
ncbi:MAG: hypothetical protein JWN51_3189 [Phycisphaerales bacterium]|nr:hypothetical protein [Phycisphaerales bacterium]